MESFKTLIKNRKMNTILIISSLIIVASIALYIGMNKFYKNKEKNESTYKPDEVFFTLYKVDWCPYCLALEKPESGWNQVRDEYNNTKTAGGLTIKFKDIDCTDEARQFIVNGKEITSYPTIFFDDGINDQVEFVSKCDKKLFEKFVKEMTRDI